MQSPLGAPPFVLLRVGVVLVSPVITNVMCGGVGLGRCRIVRGVGPPWVGLWANSHYILYYTTKLRTCQVFRPKFGRCDGRQCYDVIKRKVLRNKDGGLQVLDSVEEKVVML